MRPVRLNRRAGFTLVELMIAVLVAGLVMAAVYRVLTANQRFSRAQSQVLDVQSNLRNAMAILSADLREIDARGGDLVSIQDTAVVFRAMRGFGVACAAPSTTTGQIVLRNSLLFMPRAVDPTRDGIIAFRDGGTQLASDDGWIDGTISAVTTSGITCADGTAGTRLTTSISGGNGKYDSVTVGSPVRIYETIAYALMTDAQGVSWLGTRNLVNGAWSATTPIAGPLRATNGLQIVYRDSSGAVTATPANVWFLMVTVRGISQQQVTMPGRPTGFYADSLDSRVYLRNN